MDGRAAVDVRHEHERYWLDTRAWMPRMLPGDPPAKGPVRTVPEGDASPRDASALEGAGEGRWVRGAWEYGFTFAGMAGGARGRSEPRRTDYCRRRRAVRRRIVRATGPGDGDGDGYGDGDDGDATVEVVNTSAALEAFLAAYASGNGGALHRCGDVAVLPPQSAPREVATGALLAVSYRRDDLRPVLARGAPQRGVATVARGRFWTGRRFFACGPAAEPRLLGELEFLALSGRWEARRAAAQAELRRLDAYARHWDSDAEARAYAARPRGCAERLCGGEREYVAKRRAAAEPHLRRAVPGAADADARDLPVVALDFSGGGVRALVNAAGAMEALAEAGLAACAVYSAGVSGGSWFQAALASSPADVGSPEFADQMRAAAASAPWAAASPVKGARAVFGTLARVRAWRPGNGGAVSDVYGLFLGRQYLGAAGVARPLDAVLSEQALACDPARRPYPLYAACRPRGGGGHEWFEFSPHEVAALDAQVAVPAWAFGRPFLGGRSAERAPEQPLGALLGTWGSAFCASLDEAERHGALPPWLTRALGAVVDGGTRAVPAAAQHNFCLGMDEAAGEGGDTESETVRLVDAGVACNSGLPSLLREERGVDVVLLLDARAGNSAGGSDDSRDVLRAYQRYAAERGLPRPADGLPDEALRGIGAPGSAARVLEWGANTLVVYMPLVARVEHRLCPRTSAECDFRKFAYAPDAFDRLRLLAKANTEAALPAIRQALALAFERRRRRRLRCQAEG